MTAQFSHDTFLSVFTWRYGSPEMREIWSERYKRLLWRRIWVALAEAQQAAGLVSAEQLADLRAHAQGVDIARAEAIESEIYHDLMAEVKTFAEQCAVGGGIIHLGATSSDVTDNADALRLRESLDLLIARLLGVLRIWAEQIERWVDTPCMGFTHIQPAEPTTLGYRLAQYAQDLLADLAELRRLRDAVRGKGFKGATGTSASYSELLRECGLTPIEMEARAMQSLGLEAFPVATQTYPRKQDWLLLNGLAGLAGSMYKFAFDLRLLQSPPIGEWAEPFGRKQVGSSAMPFKRNPINAENMDSLARYLATLPRVAWDNAAHSLLERTLDDSANRRLVLPNAFLTADELLCRAERLIRGLRVDGAALARNLGAYGVFAASERLLMAVVKAGGDRQRAHEVIREHSLVAWRALQAGELNPLADLLSADAYINQYLSPEQANALLDASAYVGDAPQRAAQLAEMISIAIGEER